MIFKHKPLSESSVMKEFERIAISKGLAKSEVISKTASDESVNLEPSGDLIIDILNLAEGLRSKGFVKDAESLEEKVLVYKKAETHLYNAIDEDADDMLDFAHPKKNQVKFDAKDGHGEFEDTRSQHKKIIDIVNKKVASDLSDVLGETAEILGLKKKADLDELGKKRELVSYYKEQLSKFVSQKNAYYSAHYENFGFSREGDDNVLSIGVPDYEYVLIEGGHKNWDFPKNDDVFESKYLSYFYNSNNIIPEKLEDLKNGNISFKELFPKEDVDHANKNLINLYKTFYDKVNSLPILTAQSSDSDINKVISGVKSLFDENSWFIIKGLTNNDGMLENKIRDAASKIEDGATALLASTAKPVVNGMDEILDSGWANTIAGRFDSASTITNDKESDPEYFKNAANIIRANANKQYSYVYEALKAFDPELAKLTDKNKLDLWIQAWQKHFKVASKNDLITKKAKGDAPSAVQPASFSRPISHQNQVTTKSNFETQFPQEYTAVSDMQDAIHKLADSLPILLKGKVDPAAIQNVVDQLKATGYGEKGSRAVSVDGEWGPATQKALESTQYILGTLGQKLKLTTDAQRNQGKAVNYDTADIAKLAIANTSEIYEALNSLGVDVKDKIKSTVINDDNSPYVDSLPPDTKIFGPITTNEDPKSGLALSKDDLNSFYGLFKFLKIHELTEAQGFTTDDWEKIVLWFYGRANKQFIETKTKSKGIYQALMQKLYGILQDYVQANPDSKGKLISAKEIDGQKSSANKSNGPTTPASTNAEGVDEGNSVDKLYPAPFGYKFDLTNLHDVYGGVMNSYPNYSYLLNDVTFDVQDFGYDPTSIATTYVKLPIENILKLNHLDGNAIVPNLKIQNKPITYSQLMIYFTTNPYVVNIKSKAYDYALYQVCSGLLNDLSNVMAYWKRNTKHTQQSSDNLDVAWKKWSDTLRRTLGRINEDISAQGLAPSLQGSY